MTDTDATPNQDDENVKAKERARKLAALQVRLDALNEATEQVMFEVSWSDVAAPAGEARVVVHAPMAATTRGPVWHVLRIANQQTSHRSIEGFNEIVCTAKTVQWPAQTRPQFAIVDTGDPEGDRQLVKRLKREMLIVPNDRHADRAWVKQDEQFVRAVIAGIQTLRDRIAGATLAVRELLERVELKEHLAREHALLARRCDQLKRKAERELRTKLREQAQAVDQAAAQGFEGAMRESATRHRVTPLSEDDASRRLFGFTTVMTLLALAGLSFLAETWIGSGDSALMPRISVAVVLLVVIFVVAMRPNPAKSKTGLERIVDGAKGARQWLRAAPEKVVTLPRRLRSALAARRRAVAGAAGATTSAPQKPSDLLVAWRLTCCTRRVDEHGVSYPFLFSRFAGFLVALGMIGWTYVQCFQSVLDPSSEGLDDFYVGLATLALMYVIFGISHVARVRAELLPLESTIEGGKSALKQEITADVLKNFEREVANGLRQAVSGVEVGEAKRAEARDLCVDAFGGLVSFCPAMLAAPPGLCEKLKDRLDAIRVRRGASVSEGFLNYFRSLPMQIGFFIALLIVPAVLLVLTGPDPVTTSVMSKLPGVDTWQGLCKSDPPPGGLLASLCSTFGPPSRETDTESVARNFLKGAFPIVILLTAIWLVISRKQLFDATVNEAYSEIERRVLAAYAQAVAGAKAVGKGARNQFDAWCKREVESCFTSLVNQRRAALPFTADEARTASARLRDEQREVRRVLAGLESLANQAGSLLEELGAIVFDSARPSVRERTGFVAWLSGRFGRRGNR